ncbi:N5-carboxyaminoimidazole ribonucleotide mutase, partial [Thalictrum thalictroides]
DNICHIVKAPADVPWKIRNLATDVAKKAVNSLDGAGVFAVELFLAKDGQVRVVSAHRTPSLMYTYAATARKRGIQVIIAGAAHLPGMVAAMTPLPVIGVPVRGSALDGTD